MSQPAGQIVDADDECREVATLGPEQGARRRSSLGSLQCDPFIFMAATWLMVETSWAAPNGISKVSHESMLLFHAQHAMASDVIPPTVAGLGSQFGINWPSWLLVSLDGVDEHPSAIPLAISGGYPADDINAFEERRLHRRAGHGQGILVEDIPHDVPANESPPALIGNPSATLINAEFIDRPQLQLKGISSRTKRSIWSPGTPALLHNRAIENSKKMPLDHLVTNKMAAFPRPGSLTLLKRIARSPQSIRGYASKLPPYKNSNYVFEREQDNKLHPHDKFGDDRDKERKTYLSAYSPETAQMLHKHTRFSFRG